MEKKLILFQGDSVTDAGRDRKYDQDMGIGYPTMVAGSLGLKYPEQYTFLNRGISGERVVDLYARIKVDMINLKPDYMSILIGVNDVWHEFDWKNGVDSNKYEKIYGMLIEELQAALPSLKIMIMEPFVLPGTATVSETDTGKYDRFSKEVYKRAAAAKRVAEKYGLPFVALQEKLNEQCKLALPSYWLMDGVHPTQMGHEIIKNEWIKTFEKIK